MGAFVYYEPKWGLEVKSPEGKSGSTRPARRGPSADSKGEDQENGSNELS